MVVERDGHLSWASRATERVLGWSPRALCGCTLDELYRRLHWTSEHHHFEAVLGGEGARSVQLRLRTRDAELRRFNARFSALHDAEGELVGALLVARDETELQRLRAVAEAVNLATNVGQMFAGIRHELGNPTNSLKTALTVLRTNWQSFEPAHVDHYFERMLVEIGRVEYLLRSLRSFSAFENLQPARLSLHTTLSEIMRLSVRTAAARGVEVNIDTATALEVEADERALYHILLNLVTNAMDAVSDTRGTISVRTRRCAPHHVLLEVIDDGPGIPPDQLEAIRRPFFTTKAHGTGLGLTIVDRLVTEMGAQLRIESQPGNTVVAILLPEASDGA